MSNTSQHFYREVAALIQKAQWESAVARLRFWLESFPGDEIAMSLLGSALMQLQRIDEAIEVFRRATALHPTSFAALGDLGFACIRTGRKEEAAAAFQNSVDLNGDFYQGWCYLSQLRFEAGAMQLAMDALVRAEACDPHSAKFSTIQVAMRHARFADAEKSCRALLVRQSGYPKAAYTLAHLASRVGAHEEASRILLRAISSYPCDVNLRTALVVSLEESGQYSAAVSEAKTITVLKPDVATSWLILGRVHGHCGEYQECLDCYDRGLLLAGNNQGEIANTHLLRGHILKILGRFADSIEAYKTSISYKEDNGAGWWGLADMKTFSFSAADITAMLTIANCESVSVEQRTQAAFALGKAYEEKAQYEDAFAWYDNGNRIRVGANFDPTVQQAGINEIMRAYDASTLTMQADPLPRGPVPIFVVGLPRSGSTLIEQILASHSLIEGTMELATLPNVVRRISIDGGQRHLQYPLSMAAFSAGELAEYGQAYLDQTAMYRTGKPYFIDKLPTNFDKVGLIHMILPQAIVIDARRHPLDCGLSCYKQHFAGGHLFSYRLDHIGHYYNAYLQLMDHWDKVMPGKVHCMQYEKVIDETELSVKTLLDVCGVPFEESCVRFFENKRPVRTASSEQVRQPIYRNSVGHWRHFKSHLTALTDSLGASTLARFESP